MSGVRIQETDGSGLRVALDLPKLAMRFDVTDDGSVHIERVVLGPVSGRRTDNCVHNQGANGDLVDCKKCSGNVRLKVFGCAVHGACTLSTPVDGYACCGISKRHGCDDYQPAATPLSVQSPEPQ